MNCGIEAVQFCNMKEAPFERIDDNTLEVKLSEGGEISLKILYEMYMKKGISRGQ